MKPFFAFEDFLSIRISREFVNYDNLCGVNEATVLANAKVAPLLEENEALKKLLHAANDEWAAAEKRAEQLIKENERLKLIEKLMASDPEWGNEYAAVTHFKSENEKLTEQNASLRSQVTAQAEIISTLKEALEDIANQKLYPGIGEAHKNDAIEALAAVKKLEWK